jgi:hypothetical protein
VTEDYLLDQLHQAMRLLKAAGIYLETWYQQSHSGTGMGARNLKLSIDRFILDMTRDGNADD